MSRLMLVAFALALLFGFMPEAVWAQSIVPMISLNTSENRSGHIADFEPHLFLTPFNGEKSGSPESTPAVAVRSADTSKVLAQIFLTGVISRPEEYKGLGKVYGVIHQRPVGYLPPSDVDKAESDYWVKEMRYSDYRRLAGKKVQYLESTPAELVVEIPRPRSDGTYFYIVQIANEWRIDTTTGMPVVPIALRQASKSTKYSPFCFRIDWLSDESYDRLAGIIRPETASKSEIGKDDHPRHVDEGHKAEDQKNDEPQMPRSQGAKPEPAPKVTEWDTQVSLEVTKWDTVANRATDELRKRYNGRFAFLITHGQPSVDMQPPVSPSEKNAPKGVILDRIRGGQAVVKSHLKATGPVWVICWITCDEGWSKPRWAKIDPNQGNARVRFPLTD